MLSFALAEAGVLADTPLKLDQDPGVESLSFPDSIRTVGTKVVFTTVPSTESGTVISDSGFASLSVAPPTVTVGVIRNIPIADPTKCHGLPDEVSGSCAPPIFSAKNSRSTSLLGATHRARKVKPESAESDMLSLFVTDRSVCLAQLEQLELSLIHI